MHFSQLCVLAKLLQQKPRRLSNLFKDTKVTVLISDRVGLELKTATLITISLYGLSDLASEGSRNEQMNENHGVSAQCLAL